MKTIPALVLAAVLGVALLAGVTTYQLASASNDHGSPAATPAAPATPAAARTHAPRVRWAPCKPPAVRRGQVCVTEEVRTVVVPAPATAPAPAPAAAPVVRSVRTGDDHPEHAGDDRGGEREHESGDDGPEHESEHEDD